MKKKIIKLNKKSLEPCPHCGKPKIKDETRITNDRMHVINEVMQRLDDVRLA